MALSDRTLRAYDRAMLERSTPIVIRQNHPSNTALPMHTKSATSARRRRHTALAARTLAARETTRETRGARLARRFPFVRARGSRVDRGRETPSRGAHRSVGRIGFRGAAAARLDRRTPWTSRDRPTRGRDARDRGRDARWEKARARSRERSVDRRVGRREIERGRGGRIGGGRFRVTSHDSQRKGS